MDQPGRNIRLAAGLCFALAALTHARGPWGGDGSGYGPPSGFPGYGGGGSDSDGDGDVDADDFFNSGRNGNNGNGNFPGSDFAGFDVSAAMHYRWIHGILCALAMVILFPLGSILMRVIPGRFAIWIHAAFQAIAMIIYIAGAGLGIYLATMVQLPFGNGGNLLTNDATKYHPIIGLVTLVILLPQPLFGWLHHAKWRRVRRRQLWSYLHLFNGRVGITIGIINGGLGLNLAGAPENRKRVYTIVAAVIWALWMLVAIWAEVRKVRQNRKARDAVLPPAMAAGGRPPAAVGAMDAPPAKRRSESRGSRSRSRSGSRDRTAKV